MPGFSILVRCVCIIKEVSRWRHQLGHTTGIQFTDQLLNESTCRISGSASARTFKHCQIFVHNKRITHILWTTCSRDLGTIYRPVIDQYNCQMCMHNKRVTYIMSSAWSWDLDTINRPVTKWVPDILSQILQVSVASNFVRCVGIK